MSTQDNSKTSSQSQNSPVKRVSKYRVSAERAEQFKKDFSPELIFTLPGLSGPVVKPHKNTDGEDK
jgi:predicted flavoprotein YhiN